MEKSTQTTMTEPPANRHPNEPSSVYSGIDLDHAGHTTPISNGVANFAQMEAIKDKIMLINVGLTTATAASHLDEASARKAQLLFAIHCGDIGSSMNTGYYGIFTHDDIPGTTGATSTGGIPAGGKLTHADIVRCILAERITIRQFCMYLAPLVWNFYLTYRAPANWAKKGFTDNTKLAAFDFFSGVEHESSAKVDLIRQPNPWERTAAQTAFAVYVARSAARASGYTSNAVEISRGAYLGTGTRLSLPAPPSSALT